MRNPSSSSSSASRTPCCSKVGIKKGPWTPEEDGILSSYIKREGEGQWHTVPKRAGLLRCGKSCRLRWMNYLRPSVKRGSIASDEEDLILRLHRLLGNRWSLIAGRIPGRTDNEIKNYWNTHLRKKLISQGLDPRTHKPLIVNQVVHDELASSTSNPNPPSSEIMEEAGVSSTHQAATNSTTTYNIPIDDGFMMGSLSPSSHGRGYNHYQDYIHNSDEDTFSSFLDSLINDNDFMTHIDEQQQQQSSISIFDNIGTIDWEFADVLSTKLNGSTSTTSFKIKISHAPKKHTTTSNSSLRKRRRTEDSEESRESFKELTTLFVMEMKETSSCLS